MSIHTPDISPGTPPLILTHDPINIFFSVPGHLGKKTMAKRPYCLKQKKSYGVPGLALMSGSRSRIGPSLFLSTYHQDLHSYPSKQACHANKIQGIKSARLVVLWPPRRLAGIGGSKSLVGTRPASQANFAYSYSYRSKQALKERERE